MVKKTSEPTSMAPSMHLDHEALKQFGLHKGDLPKVGTQMALRAMAHVKSVGESETGRHMHVELHDMTVGPGKKKLKPDGDTAGMNKGMKHAMDKAVVGPKEEGLEEEDGSEA